MRCGHLDGLQRLRVEPVVAVAKAEDIDRADLAIDDGEFELAVKRSRLDVSPLRAIEKSEQGCHEFFHRDELA